jgi:hypothetical protein
MIDDIDVDLVAINVRDRGCALNNSDSAMVVTSRKSNVKNR